MFYVYIIYSESTDTFYRGYTKDIDDRLKRHNDRREKATKSGAPWKLIWCTSKNSRREAMALEKKIKNLSRKRLAEFMTRYSSNGREP